jgi:hypothetical protein
MSVQSFKAIKNFVSDLGEIFSADIHALALYERLLIKTTVAHTEVVEKHIQCFTKFLQDNEEVICTNQTQFTGNIVYSTKVYIDMNEVYRIAPDEETRKTISKHLLTLLALLTGSTKAKDLLKENALAVEAVGGAAGDEEEDFLTNIISKVEAHVKPDTTNPQDALASVMSSNMIPELVSSLNTGVASGKLDLNKMMFSVQKMVGNLSSESQGDPMVANSMKMLTNMMSMMNLPK